MLLLLWPFAINLYIFRSWRLWTLPLASASPGYQGPERDKFHWLCLFRLVSGCLQPQRGVMVSRPQSQLFFLMQLFKLTFEEKATRNAISRVEIRRFSDCLTYLNQRTVKWTASGRFDQEGSGAGMGLCDWFRETGTPSPLLPCVNLELLLPLSKELPFWSK